MIRYLKGLLWISLACWVMSAGSAEAEKMYVTEIIEITVRLGPGIDHKVIAMVKSGQELDLIEYGKEWSKIRLPAGKEGFVLSRFLIKKPSTSYRIKHLEDRQNAIISHIKALEKGTAKIKKEIEGFKTLKLSNMTDTSIGNDMVSPIYQYLNKMETEIKALDENMTQELAQLSGTIFKMKNQFRKVDLDQTKLRIEALERHVQELMKYKAVSEINKRLDPKVNFSSKTGAIENSLNQNNTLSRKVLEAIDLYKLEIAYHIEKKWAFILDPSEVVSNLEAVLAIKIMPDGHIQDVWFEKKSGNSRFDESTIQAIKISSPLPPLPKEYTRPFYNVGLVFTPVGLRKGSVNKRTKTPVLEEGIKKPDILTFNIYHKTVGETPAVINKVELSDENTRITFEVSNNIDNKCWYLSDPNAPYLLADQKRYTFLSGNNIANCLNRKSYSIEDNFILIFEPLPKNTKYFHLIEGEKGAAFEKGYWNFLKVELK